jgi:pyruvate,water dikinase
MTSLLDTELHPRFRVYSAGNFAEVAPARLSPMSWSLIGEPVERGNRAMVQRIWPRSTWHTGSRYVFAGYFNCRPYHNLAAYCHLAAQLPALEPHHVVAAYFQDAPVPEPAPRARPLSRIRPGVLMRLTQELLRLRPRLVELEGRVTVFEEGVREVARTGDAIAAGVCCAEGRELLDTVWDAHYVATLGLVPVRVLRAEVGERTVEHYAEVEPYLDRPGELSWTLLRDAEALPGAGPADFLAHAFYEIADDRSPWREYAVRPSPVVAPEERARASFDPGARLWPLLGARRSAPLAGLSKLVGELMASRELSKSLAMRTLHGFRRLVPELAQAARVPDERWPYLTLGELAGPRRDGAERRADARRRACERALTVAMPVHYAPDDPSGAPVPTRRGCGVSPGAVRGVVVGPDGDLSARNGARILVCESADAELQPLLAHVDGVVTARGSVLSHVSILVREQGIPAVVGHPLAERLKPGQTVAIDGTSGEVSLVGD